MAMAGAARAALIMLPAVAAFALPASASVEPPSSVERVPTALLLDTSSGQTLYSRNADRRIIPASMTKVMTLFVAFEMLSAGELSEDQELGWASDAAFEEWGQTGSTMFLGRDDRVTVENALAGIATVSANDASIVLAETAAGSVEGWTARMNTVAKELALVDSHFATPNGWPDEGQTFSSARDLAQLGQAMINRHPDLYDKYIGRRSFSYGGFGQDNRDPLIGRVLGADGIKTGYTRQAGHSYLGSVLRGDRRLMVVVAGAEGEEQRALIARDLAEFGFAQFTSVGLFDEGEQIGFARVQDGNQDRLSLVTSQAIRASIPQGKAKDVTLALRYDGPLRTPIAKGERVAELEIRVPGLAPSRVPLLAGEAVEKAGLFQRIRNGFAGFLS